MSNTRLRRALSASCLSLAIVAALPTAAQTLATATNPPDSGLFTSYSIGPDYTSVNWLVCGSTQQTEGCYGLGTIRGFGHVAAMMEGIPQGFNSSSGTVIRHVYVCDVESKGTGVTLYDYKKTDVVSSSDDASTVTLVKSVPLPLTGGANTSCFMAADNGYLFVGTNQGSNYARVSKSKFAVQSGSEFGVNISSITADKYGFVDVTYGNEGFDGFGPDGYGVEDGGGVEFKVGTTVGLHTLNLPTFFTAFPASRMKIGPRKNAIQLTPTQPADSLDGDLYTDYYSGAGYTNINFVICGSTGDSEGCYSFGTIGPFGHAGSIIEGNKSTNKATSTIVRDIYVCDDAAGGGTGVTLYAYKRTDHIADSYDSNTVKLIKALPLPLIGGATANCSMAADSDNLFIGTSNSTLAVKVAKKNFVLTQTSALDPTLPLSTITADRRGYVVATFGAAGTPSAVNDFNPAGNIVQATGGTYFLLNTTMSVQTGALSTTEAALSEALLSVKPKTAMR